MILILGGSGSGKSAFAEKKIKHISDKNKLKMYYLATMKVYGEREEKIVEDHRKMRAGKGFETIEQPEDIVQCLGKMEGGKNAALLECMSNLAANEMFKDGKIVSEDDVVSKVCGGISELDKNLEELVIVSNNIFNDGVPYDDVTLSYIRSLAKINAFLAGKADEVWETVAGIPIKLKTGD
jgi:adenosylcobinamide kinase/adenosylcobinamide-phosphate guanylyltransferase